MTFFVIKFKAYFIQKVWGSKSFSVVSKTFFILNGGTIEGIHLYLGSE